MPPTPSLNEWFLITQDPTTAPRFAEFMNIKLGRCWNWKGAKREGYGNIRINGKTVSAHRASYCLFVGPIPDGLFMLHSCDNKNCVNPDHLSPGTHKQNMKEASERITWSRSGFCKNGHNDWTSNGRYKTCRICRQKREKGYREQENPIKGWVPPKRNSD